MSTSRDFTEYVLNKLKNRAVFTVKSMFGEYAMYANSKVVGLICDNTLYIKIMPESLELEKVCEKDAPYPGAKMYYVVAEEQLDSLPNLIDILISIASAIPLKKKKPGIQV